MTDILLKFVSGNSKLAPNIFTFSLPAGYACPGAKLCKSQCVKVPGTFKIKDGPDCQFRCYAAIDEVLKPTVRAARWHNFNLLQGKSMLEMAGLIHASLPKVHWKFMVRLHVSGDFFSQTYFDAWKLVAFNNPNVVFYGYTKSLKFWVKRLGTMPDNFKLVASWGGQFDNLIAKYGLRAAYVVYSEDEAKRRGLQIDHDDSHLYAFNRDFALLLHGTQPAGSEAAKAWQRLKEKGKGGYHNQRRGRGWNGKPKGGGTKSKHGGGTSPSLVGVDSWEDVVTSME